MLLDGIQQILQVGISLLISVTNKSLHKYTTLL